MRAMNNFRIAPLLLLLFSSVACQFLQEKEKNPTAESQEIKDTLQVTAAIPQPDRRKEALHSLLQNPLDLEGYKQKKRGANGGASLPKSFDGKPDTVGHYYTYFWFHELRRRFRSESESTDATVVYSYIYGEEIGTYDAVEEELIGIKSRIEDDDLGKLNLVGKESAILIDEYNLSISDDYLFGSFKGTILVLHLSNGIVDWFRYRKTTLAISSFEDVPPYLLQYGGSAN